MEQIRTPGSKILIVGGGFGGVRTAVRLSRQRGLDVTLISNLATFAYYPQFYHSATGGSRSEAALPLTDVLAGTGVRLVQDVIVKIDPEACTITSIDGKTSYPYDELIMALGCVTNYFGIKGLSEFSYGIKSIDEAERFKAHLHEQLLAGPGPDLNYVVVGAGPTGVELAASLGAYLDRITALHGLEPRDYHIELVEAAPRILPRSSEAVSRRVHRRLAKLGVEVITGAAVKAETAQELQLEGKSIATRTVVWTAGTSVNPFYYANGAHFQLAKGGRVMVSDHLEAKNHVYVIGDNAATQYSGMAQTAIRDADFVAADIARAHAGRRRPAYKPFLPVSVIPVGEYWAVAEWGRLRLYGLPGYILRRAADLIGYADIERWPQAIRVWLQDGQHDDNCQICAARQPQN
ncbi:MAG TPA: NAD(P)/FAD-dependent oxidoreductase [Candidatus Saccharimonadia bacterium]|nr:NAD(P)/FAD-dependent oxidoreductase [Candidatus Saccharimonadia bacterium]